MTTTDNTAPAQPAQETEKPSTQPNQTPRPVISQPAYEKKSVDVPIVKRDR